MSRAKARFIVAAAVILALAAAGVATWRASRPAIQRVHGLNVLLVTIDTLRADAVGAYGRAGTPTPLLDRLASGGARFTRAHAHNVVTLPSHANVLSGRLPMDHNVRDNAGFRFPPGVETLATHLKRQGYRTGAFVSAFPLDSRFGLDAGFDVYDDHFTGSGARPAFLIQERPAARTVDLARQWIESAAGQPWFAWVHVYEPHFPYEPPARFADRWPGEPYIGEVAAADAALAPLLEPVLASGTNSRTIVVVTSDHGEALGEHGEATHGIFAYEGVLRVPLVLHAPAIFAGQRVVETAASHVDILPTLLDALALPLPSGLPGRSLLPAIGGSVNDEAGVYFEALSGALNRGWAPLAGLMSGGFKYIDLPIPELYDLRSDPDERLNLAARQPERLAALRRQLDLLTAADRREPAVRESADARERLRSLGYVTGTGTRPPREYTEADDPKRLIELDTAVQRSIERYLAGDLAGALAEARAVVERRPSMALGWMQVAQLEREAGNPAAAVDALKRVVALSPGDPEPLALLGAALTEAGRAADAAELLRPHARQADADPDIVSSLALALARLGRFDEALAVLASGRERDPSNAMLLVHVGTVQLSRGERGAAREAFAAAVRLDPEAARAHSSLGVLALEDGDRAAAFHHWRQATAADPREHGSVLSLGIALARAGRTAEARAAFEFFAETAPPSRHAADLQRVRAWLNGAR